MSEQMVNRLREELTRAHTRVRESTDRIDVLEKDAVRARALAAEASFFQDELSLALAAKAAAEKQANASRRKQEDAERDAARARSQLEESQRLLDAVREESRQLGELNERISQAKHVGDLFAQTNEQEG